MQNTTITNLNKLILHRAVKKKLIVWTLQNDTWYSAKHVIQAIKKACLENFDFDEAMQEKTASPQVLENAFPFIFSWILCSAWAW